MYRDIICKLYVIVLKISKKVLIYVSLPSTIKNILLNYGVQDCKLLDNEKGCNLFNMSLYLVARLPLFYATLFHWYDRRHQNIKKPISNVITGPLPKWAYSNKIKHIFSFMAFSPTIFEIQVFLILTSAIIIICAVSICTLSFRIVL